MDLQSNIQPRRNLEIKARCPDLAVARSAALSLGARPAGTFHQVDTYFAVSKGRLKLRQIHGPEGSQAELIFYERPDNPSARMSSYYRLLVPDPDPLRAVLSAALGVVAVVSKRRELLRWENVRIHLDEVENLGNFIEFEALLDSDDNLAASQMRLDRLSSALKVRAQDRIATSYGEMLSSLRASPPGR